jgi:PilZ domain
MDECPHDHEGTAATGLGDERREFRRIDDRVLLDYSLLGDDDAPVSGGPAVVHDEAIHALIAQSTADVLAHASTPEIASLGPWLLKMDWMMELVLKTLRRMANDGLTLPRMTEVNLSANGVRFRSASRIAEGDRVALEMILPPFTPIRAVAVATRVAPDGRTPDGWLIATQFVEIKDDDRERLIRHILQLEAERLRARRSVDAF